MYVFYNCLHVIRMAHIYHVVVEPELHKVRTIRADGNHIIQKGPSMQSEHRFKSGYKKLVHGNKVRPSHTHGNSEEVAFVLYGNFLRRLPSRLICTTSWPTSRAPFPFAHFHSNTTIEGHEFCRKSKQ